MLRAGHQDTCTRERTDARPPYEYSWGVWGCRGSRAKGVVVRGCTRSAGGQREDLRSLFISAHRRQKLATITTVAAARRVQWRTSVATGCVGVDRAAQRPAFSGRPGRLVTQRCRVQYDLYAVRVRARQTKERRRDRRRFLRTRTSAACVHGCMARTERTSDRTTAHRFHYRPRVPPSTRSRFPALERGERPPVAFSYDRRAKAGLCVRK